MSDKQVYVVCVTQHRPINFRKKYSFNIRNILKFVKGKLITFALYVVSCFVFTYRVI